MSIKEEPIIQVKNLSKQYKIGADTTYKTLSGSITDTIRYPLKSLKNYNKQNEIFWALKDINFEVNRGEVVGIIGRNGAGKSTLLKILSRITHPTEGEIKLRGRVGSLLEVGTGFHPELTGRENIYFNGAILGMKKREIDEKFDEVVKFAEVDKFLDTPVKRYSSGMYVRLAFAVAAHMDPEILIVDEVLAVGDVAFQKKCLGKMSKVAEGGRTVLFVSHNMAAIRQLCSRVIYLNDSSIKCEGDVSTIVNDYLQENVSEGDANLDFSMEPDESCIMQLVKGRIKAPTKSGIFDVFDRISIEFEFVVRELVAGYSIYFEVVRNGEVLFVSFDTSETPELLEDRLPGCYKTIFEIPSPLFKPGYYTINIAVGRINTPPIQELDECLKFEVNLVSKRAEYTSYSKNRRGVIAVPLIWRTEFIGAINNESV